MEIALQLTQTPKEKPSDDYWDLVLISPTICS